MRTTGEEDATLQGFDDLTVDELRRRGTAKWSHYGNDVLAAWVAEMDFPIAPVIKEALVDAVERSTTGYPTEALTSGLPQACAGWLATNFGVEADPQRVHILPDVLVALGLAIEAFTPAGSPVIIVTPSYPPFFEVVRVAGREIVQIPALERNGRFLIDCDAVDDALRDGAGSIILCNPHNPLGTVYTRDELEVLAETVERRGARVMADEVHAPLVYPGVEFVSYSTVSEAAAGHSVTITSASKGWNVAGLKCAEIVLTNQADAEIWQRFSFLDTHGASILGILANRVAFEQGGVWLRDVVAYLDGNRRLLADLLDGMLPEVRYFVPQGTYLAWLDCRPLGIDNPAQFFLERAGVAVNDGATFGLGGEGHVRLNFATSRAILTEIVTRMARAVRSGP